MFDSLAHEQRAEGCIGERQRLEEVHFQARMPLRPRFLREEIRHNRAKARPDDAVEVDAPTSGQVEAPAFPVDAREEDADVLVRVRAAEKSRAARCALRARGDRRRLPCRRRLGKPGVRSCSRLLFGGKRRLHRPKS
jgi:hypothetical protein